jgi:radical SAM protein with 4Fe4S-binding SPASM domain
MDGADADTFNDIRHGADFDTVTANIRALNAIKSKKKTDKPRLSLAAVALTDNWQQMPDLVDMARDLGMGHVHVESLMWQDDPKYLEYYREHCLDDMMDKVMPKIQEAQSKAAQYHIGYSSTLLDGQMPATDTATPPDWIPGTSKGIPCWEPWTTIFVTWQGEVHPCCGSEQEMGNLRERDIMEIWNSPDYQKLRRDFIDHTPPAECQVCIKNRRMKRVIPTVRQWITKALS